MATIYGLRICLMNCQDILTRTSASLISWLLWENVSWQMKSCPASRHRHRKNRMMSLLILATTTTSEGSNISGLSKRITR
nr:MAG TPA: hypothetical protein [Bacteriophage sp.]